jgi:phenylacetate-CoA ligase
MDANQLLFRFLVYYPVVWARGQRVPAYLHKLMDSQRLDIAAIEALQSARLHRMVAHAQRSVPFYRNALRTSWSHSAAGLERLRELPTVSKRSIKSDPTAFLSGERLGPLTKKTTGGSTGEPVSIFKTRQAMAWELAATWRGYAWAGIDIGDRQGRFWGVPLDPKSRLKARLIDLVTNRRRCSAFAFDDHDLDAYTAMLHAFKPSWFYGYVSMIGEYARFLRRTGTKSPFKLKAIVTTSEVLTETQRTLIEEVFSTRVFNEYGSGELGTVAHECEHGSLHLSAENMIVEVLDGDRPCEPGRVGELVVTELHNLAMPLIRYRTGDFASLSDRPCRCGRTLPVIENLHGRAYDTIRNRAGRVFHAEFLMYIFEEAQRRNLGIRAFQVVQEDLEAFRVRVVPEYHYGSAAEDFIRGQIRAGFDPAVGVRFERVERIERMPSGKMQVIVGMGSHSAAPDEISNAVS